MSGPGLNLRIQSAGTLDKNQTALASKVDQNQFDTVKAYLSGLEGEAKVRIVNGRSKNKDLELSTKSNSGNFYSRKPVTQEFFKQVCIKKFGDRPEIHQAFKQSYDAVTKKDEKHTATHFLTVMNELQAKFGERPDVEADFIVLPPNSERIRNSIPKEEAPIANLDGSHSSDEIAIEGQVDLGKPEPLVIIQDKGLNTHILADDGRDEVVDSDIPDLIADAVVSEPNIRAASVQGLKVEKSNEIIAPEIKKEALTKSHQFSIEVDAPPLKAKAFNTLDHGEHKILGEAIDKAMAERGLMPKRGISKIEINGEKVYCYFDKAGKARAILPKGNQVSVSEYKVRELPIDFSALDLIAYIKKYPINPDGVFEYRGDDLFYDGELLSVPVEGNGNESADKGSIRHEQVAKKARMSAEEEGDGFDISHLSLKDAQLYLSKLKLTKEEDFNGRAELISFIFGKIARMNPSLRSQILESVIKNNERGIFQFNIGNHSWLASISRHPSKIGNENVIWDSSSLNSEFSVTLNPLDQPLEYKNYSTDELKKIAPNEVFDKNSIVTFAHNYRDVRTTLDGAYVKKFYQATEDKLDFFETLLANENASPGILNRMLVGVPVADKEKSIGPSGPSGIMNTLYWSSVPDEDIEPLKKSLKVLIDDLKIISKNGFGMPEGKMDHYMLGQAGTEAITTPKTGERRQVKKLQIYAIDFNRGIVNIERSKGNFENAIKVVLGDFASIAFKRGGKGKSRTEEEVAEILAPIRDYMKEQLATF